MKEGSAGGETFASPVEEAAALRAAVRDLIVRMDQVRAALSSETRALDDKTLAHLLDTGAARSLLAAHEVLRHSGS